MKIKIYHNNKCSKSRFALQILNNNNYEIEVINYLINPPSLEELTSLLSLLNMNAIDLVRKKEQLYLESYKEGNYTNDEWLEILNKNPILIERPIIIKGKKAIIARDEKIILEFIK